MALLLSLVATVLMVNGNFQHLLGCLLQLQLVPSKHYSLNGDGRARFIKPVAFDLNLVSLYLGSRV